MHRRYTYDRLESSGLTKVPKKQLAIVLVVTQTTRAIMSESQTEIETDANGLPYIKATSYYDTQGAATVLGCTDGQLRQWRHRKCGPKYQKPSGGIVRYLGLWTGLL